MKLTKPDRELIIGGIVILALVVLVVAGELDAETAIMGVLGVAASMGVYQAQ